MFTRTIIAIISGLLLFASCDVADDSDSGNATMRVVLTDAPAAYDAVWIDIEEVRIHLNEEADEGDNGWITINEEPMMVNLLELTNGELKVLGEEELEAGQYSQIRLILGEDNEVVEDGITHFLKTPSAQQSGLKINIHANVEGGRVYTLLLDFDASRSIVKAGNSGNYILKPVLRAVELAETGAVEGNIQPAEALPWVYAIADSDTVAGTQANAEGNFRIVGLLSGSYDLAIDPAKGDYSSTELADVEVIAPDTTEVGPVILEEE